MSDKMREAFEARFPVPAGVYWNASGLYYVRNLADDEAVSLAVEWNTMLSVWQAAHAAALPPGFVAVPVEPTEDEGSTNDCWCSVCRPANPFSLRDNRMIVCPDCGNKRCPKANSHLYRCSGSNEPNQVPTLAARPEVK